MYGEISFDLVIAPSGAVMLVAVAFLIVFLTENSRIPIDDPTTHLELTMIHEVMVLDHSGPDLAFVEYTSALKLWVLGALLVGIAVPVRTDMWVLDYLAGVVGMFALAVFTGVLESTMARLRLSRVPQFLVAAVVFSGLALVLVLR
jgi:formate hydrogenlyase subunit 4